jgi:hypothetical protein
LRLTLFLAALLAMASPMHPLQAANALPRPNWDRELAQQTAALGADTERLDQWLDLTRAGDFGPGFDPDAVQELPWGSLELDLDCDRGRASFDPTEPGFPGGTLDLVRLTALEGLACAASSH